MHPPRRASSSPARPRGRRLAIAASIALHAVVFAALAIRLADAAAPGARAMRVRLVLPPGTLLPAPDGDGPLPPRTLAAGSRVRPSGCQGTVYTGIGASVNRAGYIVELAPAGPAEQAGLRRGDAILNLEELPIDSYPSGRIVGVRLLRDGVETATEVRIGAICDEAPLPIA